MKSVDLWERCASETAKLLAEVSLMPAGREKMVGYIRLVSLGNGLIKVDVDSEQALGESKRLSEASSQGTS